MRGILEPGHLVIILLIVLLLFGGKRIPEIARGLGKGIREFKDGMNNNGSPEPSDASKALKKPETPESPASKS